MTPVFITSTGALRLVFLQRQYLLHDIYDNHSCVYAYTRIYFIVSSNVRIYVGSVKEIIYQGTKGVLKKLFIKELNAK